MVLTTERDHDMKQQIHPRQAASAVALLVVLLAVLLASPSPSVRTATPAATPTIAFPPTRMPQSPAGPTNYSVVVAASSANVADRSQRTNRSIGVPAAPSAASALSGDSTAFLRWTPPSNNGAALTGYRITPIVGGVAQAVRSIPAANGAQAITGLTNGSVATFRIAASNQRGTGPAVETRAVTVGRYPLTSTSSWLDIVNYVRQSSGESGVTENKAWVAGLQAHYRYLAKTPAAQKSGRFASAHTENPASAWYTAAGQAAAASADLLVGELGNPKANITGWLESPFHAIGIIRPDLASSAYASGSGAAGIDVIRGLDGSRPSATRPVLLPGPGAITTSRSYSRSELPNPLESCHGFRSPGLPIVALLPKAPPAVVTASLKQPNGTRLSGIDLCVITARTFVTSDKTYGPAGLSVLKDSNAVILIPRTPLQTGRQTVTLSPSGSAPITWSFSVAAS